MLQTFHIQGLCLGFRAMLKALQTNHAQLIGIGAMFK